MTSDQRDPARELELWKHFAAAGAADKNTMIVVVSWLLGFTAALVGFIFTEHVATQSPRLRQSAALAGIIVSALAAYVALLYGGYTNRNWAQADEIARRNDWVDLIAEPSKKTKPTKLFGLSDRLARDCDPRMELAPVFSFYSWLAILAGLTQLAFLAGSVF